MRQHAEGSVHADDPGAASSQQPKPTARATADFYDARTERRADERGDSPLDPEEVVVLIAPIVSAGDGVVVPPQRHACPILANLPQRRHDASLRSFRPWSNFACEPAAAAPTLQLTQLVCPPSTQITV